MKCTNCGAELDKDSTFCTECGAKCETENPVSEDQAVYSGAVVRPAPRPRKPINKKIPSLCSGFLYFLSIILELLRFVNT